ncbi:MAG: response regulator [Alphaproteobacteria bacterium]|nr:MAG: response regulator [Alphaproteobacteria bacterium]
MFSNPILLIDDEPVIRDLYARMLEGRGYKVVTVGSAEDALDVVHADLPALIISDVLMPGISGHELCAKLSRADEKRMPFIFLTANDDYKTVRDGLTAGGDDFLVKGMDVAAIAERVRFWLATLFNSLPTAPRARAIALCEAELEGPNATSAKPITSLGGMREDLRTQAITLVRSSLEHAGADYLARDDVPLSFLGYIAGVLDVLTADDLSSLMRYCDYYDAVLTDLSPDWAARARPLFATFEDVARGELFRTARRKGQQDARRSDASLGHRERR